MKESYRIDELAERWEVSTRKIYRLIKRDIIKAFRIGHTWRVSRDEVLRCEHRQAEAQKV